MLVDVIWGMDANGRPSTSLQSFSFAPYRALRDASATALVDLSTIGPRPLDL